MLWAGAFGFRHHAFVIMLPWIPLRIKVLARPEPCYSTAFVSQHQDLLAEVGPAQHVIHAKLHAQLLVAERHRVVGQAGVAAGIVEL